MTTSSVRRRSASTGIARRWRSPEWLVLPVLVLACLVPWLGLDAIWVRETEMTAIFALIVTGLNLSYGWAGELSFAQPAIFAIGAYSTGLMSLHGYNDLLLNLVFGAVLAAVAGTVVGVPGLRLGSWSLAMVSFFLVLLIPDIVTVWQSQTGGQAGLAGIPLPKIFGHEIDSNPYFVACVLISALWLLFFRNLVRSRHGAALRILATNTVLAESAGIRVNRLKLTCYLLGSVPAGLAGVLYAYLDGYVSPGDFGFTVGIGILAASVLGGTRSVYAVVVATALLQIIPLESSSFSDYSLLLYGGLLLVGGLVFRGGIPATLVRLANWARGHVRRPSAAMRPATTQLATGERTGRGMPCDEELAEARAVLHRRDSSPPPLVVQAVTKWFGGVRALGGVDLVAEPGQVCALIGPNGSGKTTLLNVMSGFYQASSGAVTCGQQDLGRGRAWRSARFGVSRTFQTPTLPAGMSVLDTVASARYRFDYLGMVQTVLRLPSFRRVRHRDETAAWAALHFVGIGDIAHDEAAELPLGLRRRVEVARALVTKPRILLLDEPASGLSEAEVTELGQLLTEVKQMGVIVILVEHNFEFVLGIADQVVALDFGCVLATGTPDQIRHSESVRDRYLGKAAAAGRPPSVTVSATADGNTPLLDVEHLCTGYGDLRAVWDIGLRVEPGQTTVLLGANGAGKTTTLHALAGLLPAFTGTITYQGRNINDLAANRRTRQGLALVQEGKRVFRALTVEQNLMLGGWTRQGRNRRSLARQCDTMFDRFPALAEKRHTVAGSLSGGQQQILAIAQALMPEPALLMLDEPSAGLAPTIMADVLDVVRGLNAEGIGVLLVEQLVDTALQVAHQVVVVSRGHTVLRIDDPAEIGDGTTIRAAYSEFEQDRREESIHG